MKLLILSFTLLLARPILAQTETTLPAQATGNRNTLIEKDVSINVARQLKAPSTLLADSDSLVAKRRFLTTSIYKEGRSLSRSDIISSFQSTPESISKYRWGTALNPIGPIIAISGVALGYIAIKGEPTTAMVLGIRTLSNPNVPDVQVTYTNRSLPKLLGGLGLVIGGMCLIELSNELIAKSVHVYNANLNQPKKVTFIRKASVGITPDGGLGLRAWF